MERVSKKILIMVILIVLTMIVLIGESKAALQSNPNTHYKKVDNITNWFTNIRNMEKSGEAMGLNETLNTDLTPSSESNNIDVHFMRSTEYGAIAILSASGYGNPQILQNSAIKTTTGNKTGVYFSGTTWEWVAGGEVDAPANANERYYDMYNTNKTVLKIGDALGKATTSSQGCAGWHNATNSYLTGRNNRYILRGNGGLFSFGHIHLHDSHYAITNACGRAVVVNGEGL